MIPDFKTYIGESVWGDIRKRGNGTEVKDEDFIEDLYNYINSYYKIINVNEKIEYKNNHIHIPILKCLTINSFVTLYIDNLRSIAFSSINPNNYKQDSFKTKYIKPLTPELNSLYKKMKNEFNITNIKEYGGLENWYTFTIEPVGGGKITKEFCTEFIDFVLNHFDDNSKWIAKTLKKNVSESVWNDIRRRGNGTDVKKEDEIEHLDRDGMYDYIYSHYDQNPDVHALPLTSNTPGSDQYFSLPIFIYGNALYRLAAHYTDGKISRIILFALKSECEDFYKILVDTFKVCIKENGAIEITSKDDTVSNQLLLDVIDIITLNAKKPVLIKK